MHDIELYKLLISIYLYLAEALRDHSVCLCREHGGLTQLNSRLVESLQLYHSLMQELPSYSQPVVHNMPQYVSLSQVTY